VAMCYASKYPEDVSALVVEDMDIRRRSENFIRNFDEERAISFSRRHDTLDGVKKELGSIGYPSVMYNKWIGEGRIHEDEGHFWSDVNPAFRALCYRTIFYSNVGNDSWAAIARNLQQKMSIDKEVGSTKIHLMVAGIGTVCDEENIESMRQIMKVKDVPLSVKTYSEGTHSIHNSAREEFMADLSQIIKDSSATILKSKI